MGGGGREGSERGEEWKGRRDKMKVRVRDCKDYNEVSKRSRK